MFEFLWDNFIISGSGDGSMRIWNYRTGTCERCLYAGTHRDSVVFN